MLILQASRRSIISCTTKPFRKCCFLSSSSFVHELTSKKQTNMTRNVSDISLNEQTSKKKWKMPVEKEELVNIRKTNNRRKKIVEEEQLQYQGYKLSYTKLLVTCLAVLLSGGLLWFFMQWYRRVYLRCTHEKCSIEKASKILLVDSYNQYHVETVSRSSDNPSIFFYNKKMKYVWDPKQYNFVKVGGLEIQNCSEFYAFKNGLSSKEATSLLRYHGKNSIDIDVKPVVTLVLREVRNPFYLYQTFIVILWYLQFYYQFATCVVILSILSVSTTVWETRKQSKALRNAMRLQDIVSVVRDGNELQISSEDLVPGDVIIIPKSHFTMVCDAVLLTGTCVMNESMLTGECEPVSKVPIENDTRAEYSSMTCKKSLLSCGTDVLHSRDTDGRGVKAVVYRTGFSTVKGELVRAILFPKPVKIKLDSDLLKCMAIFFLLGIPALIYAAIVGTEQQTYVKYTSLFVLNVISFFMPAALPAVLTSINAQAQKRLRNQGIYCLNSRYISLCGGLDVACFDKTGTLTEDSLDLHILLPVQNGKFQSPVKDLKCLHDKLLVNCLASCHSLTKIEDELFGNDLDIKTFKATGWVLQQPTVTDAVPFENIPPRIVYPNPSKHLSEELKAIAILRQFPFESSLRRMSVVAKVDGNNHFEVFLKGAPEIVCSFSRNESVPSNIQEVLKFYTSQGFRVIGMGCKTLPENVSWEMALQLSREELEKDLQFLGLIILENSLKPETVPALNILRDANIRSIMVTGDNLLTAITVGRKCGMIAEMDKIITVEATTSTGLNASFKSHLEVEFSFVKLPLSVKENQDNKDDTHILAISEATYHFVMEGSSFDVLWNLDKTLLNKILLKGTIFARMLPDQKLHLVEALQNLGYQVGMCGDGANDCGALKTAHTGVSLSVAEASVAAPFTSSQHNIQCIPTIISEGRAALVSVFDAFRYMVCYSFIFLIAVLWLFWDGQRCSDGAFVLIDVVLNLGPPFLIGATSAFPKLAKRAPTRSLVSILPLFSIFSFIVLQTAIYLIAYKYCLSQPWYEPFKFDKENPLNSEASYSGTTVLKMNMMSYVVASIVFVSGAPYKKHFFSNKLYVSIVCAIFGLVTYFILDAPEAVLNYLNFKSAPDVNFARILYAISLGNLGMSFIWEKYIIQRVVTNNIVPFISRLRRPVQKFEKLQQELLASEEWPPLIHDSGRDEKIQVSNPETSSVINML